MGVWLDNDPSGFEAREAVKFRKTLGNLVFRNIPVYSPELQPCDWTLWSTLERRLRAAEQRLPADYRESKTEFQARVKKTLLSTTLRNLDAEQAARCERIHKKRGGVVEGIWFFRLDVVKNRCAECNPPGPFFMAFSRIFGES